MINAKHLWLCFMLGCLAVLVPFACSHTALRDADGYRAQAATHRQDALDAGGMLIRLAKTSTNCPSIARAGLTLTTRAAWREQEELHLAGLAEKPGDRPPVPGAERVCGVRP